MSVHGSRRPEPCLWRGLVKEKQPPDAGDSARCLRGDRDAGRAVPLAWAAPGPEAFRALAKVRTEGPWPIY